MNTLYFNESEWWLELSRGPILFHLHSRIHKRIITYWMSKSDRFFIFVWTLTSSIPQILSANIGKILTDRSHKNKNGQDLPFHLIVYKGILIELPHFSTQWKWMVTRAVHSPLSLSNTSTIPQIVATILCELFSYRFNVLVINALRWWRLHLKSPAFPWDLCGLCYDERWGFEEGCSSQIHRYVSHFSPSLLVNYPSQNVLPKPLNSSLLSMKQ